MEIRHIPVRQVKNHNVNKSGKVKVAFNPQDPVAGKQYIEEMPQDMFIGGKLESAKTKVVDSKYPVAGPSNKANSISGIEYIYPEGTPQADQVEIFTAINREINLFENTTGTSIRWATGLPQLTLNAHAGKMANAYYSRWERGIKFFYFPDSVNSKIMHQTAASAEISSHEAGHAIVDATHPSYLSAIRSETGAVHESMGDMFAMVTALSDPNYRAALLKETGGNLHQSSSLTYMGEDFGKGIYGATKPGHNYIRNAFNNFVYKDPKNLPYRPKDENQLGSEIHNFSRLMSGTFYEAISDIYDYYKSQGLSSSEALSNMSKDAATLLFKGLVYMPEGDAKFKDVAKAMITADKLDLGGKFKDLLTNVFTKRKLLSKQDIDRIYSDIDKNLASPNILAKNLNRVKGRLTKKRFISLALQSYAPEKVGKYDMAGIKETKDGKIIVNYLGKEALPVNGKEFAVFKGSEIDLQRGLTLILDKNGKLLAKIDNDITDKDRKDALRELLDMIKHGEVRYTDPDSIYKSESPNDIFKSNGQPYLAKTDYTSGKKKIVRIPVIS